MVNMSFHVQKCVFLAAPVLYPSFHPIMVKLSFVRFCEEVSEVSEVFRW